MLELGALQEAAVLCRRAIALDPVQPDAHFNLSHALKGMNQLDEAALAAREAIALRPDFADYHFHLAHILLLQGNFEDGGQNMSGESSSRISPGSATFSPVVPSRCGPARIFATRRS